MRKRQPGPVYFLNCYRAAQFFAELFGDSFLCFIENKKTRCQAEKKDEGSDEKYISGKFFHMWQGLLENPINILLPAVVLKNYDSFSVKITILSML